MTEESLLYPAVGDLEPVRGKPFVGDFKLLAKPVDLSFTPPSRLFVIGASVSSLSSSWQRN